MFDVNVLRSKITSSLFEGKVPNADKDKEEKLIQDLMESVTISTSRKSSRYSEIKRILEGLLAFNGIKILEEVSEGFRIHSIKRSVLSRLLPPGYSIEKCNEDSEQYKMSWPKEEEEVAPPVKSDKQTPKSYPNIEKLSQSVYKRWEEEGGAKNKTYIEFLSSIPTDQRKAVVFSDFNREVEVNGIQSYFSSNYSAGFPYLEEFVKEFNSKEMVDFIAILTKGKSIYDKMQEEIASKKEESVEAEDIELLFQEEFDTLTSGYLNMIDVIKEQAEKFFADMTIGEK